MRRLTWVFALSGLGLVGTPEARAFQPPALPPEDPGTTPTPSPTDDDATAPGSETQPPAGLDGSAEMSGSAAVEGPSAQDVSFGAVGSAASAEPRETKPGMVRGRHEPVMSNRQGPVGLFHTTLPEVGGNLSFRFRINTDFFRKDTFIFESPTLGTDRHARVRGGVNLSFTPWKYLELFFTVASQANRNERNQPNRQDAETIFALGDIGFGLKGAYEFKDGGIGLGGLLGLELLSGTQRLATSDVNFWFDVLFAADLRHLTKKHAPVRLSTNIGWMLDRSLNLVDWDAITDPTSREVTRFALGVNHNRVRMRYAIDFPVRFGKDKQFGIDPILEWSFDISTKEDSRFVQANAADSPVKRGMSWLTLGVRANAIAGLFLDAGVDIGLVSPNFEFGPPVPPWQVLLGLGYYVDPKPEIKEVEVAPADVGSTVGPPPGLEGRVVGQVVGPDGAAIPNAKITFPGLTTNAILTDESGRFTSFRFPTGMVTIQVDVGGQIVAESTAEVREGEDTQVTISLEVPAAKTGMVQGTFTDASGKPIKVTMHVRGQGVDEPFQSTEGGLILLELLEGEYNATVSAPGHQTKQITFTVRADGQIDLREQLLGDQPPATPKVSGTKSRIRVAGGIRYSGNEVASASHDGLDQLATFLAYHPEFRVIEIGVHTDDRGNPKERSEARAEAVRTHLVSKGVSPDRVQAKGYGDTKPVAVNMTAAGRAKNNRTEIRVVDYALP